MNLTSPDRMIAGVGVAAALILATLADLIPSALCYPLGTLGGMIAGSLLATGALPPVSNDQQEHCPESPSTRSRSPVVL